ncbi:MAG: cysteine desulfurase family protein [Pikeienuella sp.]
MSHPRTYLDWNASAPLRPEARAAMIAAMDEVGNPSSVHAEGRRAKAIVERARVQVAELVGCDTSEVVFTSGATEAIALFAAQQWDDHGCTPLEHDAVVSHFHVLSVCPQTGEALVDTSGAFKPEQLVSGFGFYSKAVRKGEKGYPRKSRGLFAITAASSETGVLQPVSATCREFLGEQEVSHRLCDATQAIGKIAFDFSSLPVEYVAASSHKLGGPRGSGCALVRSGIDIFPVPRGGGQEHNRRAGTENVIGIAGFGAAAEAAQRDLANGEWDRVEEMRNSLEEVLKNAAPDLIIFGEAAPRLPNTSCFAIPGWRGETQVMQMDLAGFAISAGSACSSGKVNKASRVLLAMGFDDVTASSAVRVSMGPTTTKAEVTAFADAWIGAYRRWKAKAA